MKDFIKEFEISQQGKNIPIKFEPPEEWGFESDIKHKLVEEPTSPEDDQSVSFSSNEITKEELKNVVMEAVLNTMNNLDTPPSFNELLEEQKQEIEEKIKLYCKREGIMSISLKENFDRDEATVSALIDPTNCKNWMQIKEEIIYRLPYSYKKSLHTFSKEVWDKNKLII